MTVSRSPSTSPARVINVWLALIIGVSLVGFFVGTRAAPISTPAPSRTASGTAAAEVPPSVPYRELRQRRFGPSGLVTSPLVALTAGIPRLTDPVVQTEAERSAALAARAARRAYDGAPPTIPHPIDQQGSAVCLACHRGGLLLEGRIAPVISHRPLEGCTQCHVPEQMSTVAGHLPGPRPPVESRFQGQTSPGRGERAWAGAPPIIPHQRHLRESCASCHGVTGRPGLRTTHPERRSCEQCHAPSATDLPAPAGK